MRTRLTIGVTILLCMSVFPVWAAWILQNVKPEDVEIMGFTVTREPAKNDRFGPAGDDLVSVTISKEPGENVLSAVLEFDGESGLILRCPIEAKKHGKLVSFTANINKQNADHTR